MHTDAHLLVAAGLAAAGLVLWVVWVVATRRWLNGQQQLDAEGPSTMDLGPEPPAVVNLLLNEAATTGDALAATILDLAARGHLDVVQLAPTEHLVVPRSRDRTDLTPYEVQVLQIVDQAVGDGHEATVPAISAALGRGSAMTWLTFAAAVSSDARRRGLVGSRSLGSATRWLLLVSLLPCLGLVVALPVLYLACAPILVTFCLAGIIAASIGNGNVLTPAGQQAGARWLGVRRFIVDAGSMRDVPAGAVAIWDRYLAYAAAMGLSGTAVHSLVAELRTTLSLRDLRTAAQTTRRRHAPAGVSRPMPSEGAQVCPFGQITVSRIVVTARGCACRPIECQPATGAVSWF